MSETIVSVVMPLYNEARYIDGCIASLLTQDFPKERMEWLFVDGGSTDDTVARLNAYTESHTALIRVCHNPHKTVPYAMNIGIAAATGKYIVRLDAHASYAPDYIRKCVAYLDEGIADNVGGLAETKSHRFVGSCIAKMLASPFGVGNAQFRTGGKSGYVDTVPFGAFRRDVFTRFGGYDERLTRNQDNEMNYRIRKNGGKVYLADDIHLSYYCRDSVRGIAKMAFQNGCWNIITTKLCPGAMGLRHFVPFAFVTAIVLLSLLGFVHPLFWGLLAAGLMLYSVLALICACRLATSVKEAGLLCGLFAVFHVTYGCGSLCGLIKLFSKDYRGGAYQPPKL